MLFARLGEILLDCGCITRAQWEEALAHQAPEQVPEILFARGYTTPADSPCRFGKNKNEVFP